MFQNSPKIYLAYFCKKLCHRELSKIAQSGHTDRSLRLNKFAPLRWISRILDYFFHTWPCTTLKICPIALEICQSRLKFRQIPNKTFEICQIIFKICHSGEIGNTVSLTEMEAVDSQKEGLTTKKRERDWQNFWFLATIK